MPVSRTRAQRAPANKRKVTGASTAGRASGGSPDASSRHRRSDNPSTTQPAPTLPASLLLMLAVGAGLAVATLYYSQPMLAVIGTDLRESDRAVGWVTTLAQLGYAIGIFLLAPLGDRFDRRRIILIKLCALGAALVLAGFAPNLGVLLAASLAIGLASTLTQDIVPAAATLAPAASRGKAVGTVMTGLLLGILLSRVVSGFVADHFGWRAMFFAAAVSIALLGALFWRGLPSFVPTTRLGYGRLLASLWHLFTEHGILRRAAIAQGVLSVGFSAFWSTLAVMLHGEPYHFGASVAGAFGLAGAVGALAAPLAGRLADRRGPAFVTQIGVGLVAASFAVMILSPWLAPDARLVLIVLCALGFDLGFQATLVAHQTIIYGIDAGARSRLNAVLFVGMFIGMSTGAALGSQMLARFGWGGVAVLATCSALAALVVRLWPGRATER